MISLKKYDANFKKDYLKLLKFGIKKKKKYDYATDYKKFFLVDTKTEFEKLSEFVLTSEFLSKDDNPYYEIIQLYILLCDLKATTEKIVKKDKRIIKKYYCYMCLTEEQKEKINSSTKILVWINKGNKIDDFNSDSYKKNYDELMKKVEEMNDYLKTIFDYSKVDAEIRKKIIEYQGLEVCPYCNEHYLDLFISDDKIKNDSEIDHFYPKSLFPLFGLSLYNFIPACKACNQTYKKDTYYLNMIYPYNEDFGDDAKFRLRFDGTNSYVILENNSKDSKKYAKIDNNIKLFKLNERYSGHKLLLDEIALKSSIMPLRSFDNYIEIVKEFDKGLDVDKAKKLILGYSDSSDDVKRPLGKLYRDILDK